MKKKRMNIGPENSVHLTRADQIYYIIVNCIVSVFMLVVLLPLINIVASSFSSPSAVSNGKVLLWPVDFSFEGYIAVFEYKGIDTAYLNTFFYTIFGTVFNLFMTMIAAYPMARRGLPLKGPIVFLFSFTMLFSGGMIPTYIQMVNLHLINNRLAMILPGAIGITNMIIARTFIQGIPHELYEAASIDGCDDFRYFGLVVIPLSVTLLSVLTLYYAVGHWNSYMDAFLYLSDRDKMPLQVILREILIQNTVDAEAIVDDETLSARQGMADLLKYALIIVSSLPVLVLYPLVKKYFLKGVMLGSLKG